MVLKIGALGSVGKAGVLVLKLVVGEGGGSGGCGA